MKNIKLSMMGAVVALLILATSCNKDLEQFSDNVAQPSGPRLDQALQANPNYSLYYALVVRGGQLGMINDNSKSFTMFVPGNDGIKKLISAKSGGLIPLSSPDAVFEAAINSQITVEEAAALVQYNTMPQLIKSTSIRSNEFPHYFAYPSAFNPLPTASSLLRLNVYPSTFNGAWFNNVPIIAIDQMASNGVIHNTVTMAIPSQRYLWDRISSDPQLTYLKAAIQRADSGSAPAASLQGYLSSFGPDFTIFAPVDTAFRSGLTNLLIKGIFKKLLDQGIPELIALPIATQQGTALASTTGVFTNPDLYSSLTAQNVKGILVYHVLGKRAYTNNFPTAETWVPTLLNSVVSVHPGLKLKAVFGGPLPMNPFATEATVKDVYNNSPAAKIIINASPLTPDPYGTSDQGFVNGVLHKIDRLLLPLP